MQAKVTILMYKMACRAKKITCTYEKRLIHHEDAATLNDSNHWSVKFVKWKLTKVKWKLQGRAD